jgi:hypothetical protein
MQRVFFVFLFALMALGFTACSDSDSDSGGHGYGMVPDAEFDIPFPTLDLNGAPTRFEKSSRYLLLEVTPEEYLSYYDTLNNSWNCNTNVDTDNGYDRNCSYSLSTTPPLYNFYALFQRNLEKKGDSKLYVKLYISDSNPSNALPDGTYYDYFHPEDISGGVVVANGYEVDFQFNDLVQAGRFEDYYVYELVTTNGFKLYDNATRYPYPGTKRFDKKLSDNVTTLTVKLVANYSASNPTLTINADASQLREEEE